MERNPVSRISLIVLALLVTWLVWGSSFVAIVYALDAMPPLFMMASRFIAAGLIATTIGVILARRAGSPLPCRRAWRDATIVGVGFIVVGMGATGWAATRLPTGIAALLVASAPLWIALLQVLVLRGTSSSRVAIAGLAVGVVGVGMLVLPGNGGSGDVDLAAAGVLVLANAAWAAATLFAPRAVAPGGLVLGVGMQMLTGGILLGIVSASVGELGRLSLAGAAPAAIGGWIYLVLVAAIGGFLAYGWLLENVSAGMASTHAFINPLVAVALGALLLGEVVETRMLAAGAAIIAAVVLLLVGEARTAARTAQTSPIDVKPTTAPTTVRRPTSARVASSRAAHAAGRRRSGGWSPTPTPAFAARRTARPWQATDGMDALAIDEAFDQTA